MKPLHLRKCMPHAEASLTPEQAVNVAAKESFAVRVAQVLGAGESVRGLALFFGVARSTLHERMSPRRPDLAPLPEWFAKLDNYEQFETLAAEFLRTA